MANRCIIIGASHAAAQLTASLRQEGWNGEILVISDEPHLPYHRPPLSKAFLAGDKSIEDLTIRPQSFYDKNDICFRCARVVSIKRLEQSIELDNGEEIKYDKLVLCTGSRVRKITLPGCQLKGVHYLRDISDVQGIQKDLCKAKHAVIIGGGYIGLETASAMRKLGLAVTVLEMAPRILQRVTAPELSDFYARIHAEEGVDIRTNVSVSHMTGDSQVEKVICHDGTEFIADLVVVGIGILPNTELADEAGITVNNGILVDRYCCTNDPNIYAAGDCTIHYNKIYDRDIRLESVPNASEQAKIVASSICGGMKEYASLPWFWSDQFDLKLQIAGLSEGYDQVLIRGDSTSGRSFAAFYLKHGKLISADCVNRPQEFMFSKRAISQHLEIKPELLVDESIAVKDLLNI